LDLFMHATGDYADSQPEPVASHLRHLRAHLFNPVILGLVFEAVPVSDAAFRVIFLRLLASLVVLNSQARKAGGRNGATLVHFEGQRFLALKVLMIKIHKKSGENISDFLRALIELNVSIEDQIVEQDAAEAEAAAVAAAAPVQHQLEDQAGQDGRRPRGQSGCSQ